MGYVGFALLWLLFWVLPLCGLFYLVYFLTTVPMRRQERARFFLELLDNEVRRGGNVEQTIVRLAESRDSALGARFYLVAAHVENGLRLGQALEKVPRFLPPQISRIIKAGEEVGNVKQVLPVCRSLLTDARSHTHSAFNYLIILAFVLTPVVPYIFITIRTFIMPRYMEIFHSYLGADIPPLVSFVQSFGIWLANAQLTLSSILYVAAFCYLGGPRVWSWASRISGGKVDWLLLRVPWRRNRLKRTFSAMLALLLDAKIPEPKALQLAAESTANEAFAARARTAVSRLAEGVTMTDVLQNIDTDGELRWRLANAANSSMGFQASFAGWHEALDAKAYQQEQAASQCVTTGLVILNGLLVGILVAGLFEVLIELLNVAILW